jgi:hypothetical protein
VSWYEVLAFSLARWSLDKICNTRSLCFTRMTSLVPYSMINRASSSMWVLLSLLLPVCFAATTDLILFGNNSIQARMVCRATEHYTGLILMATWYWTCWSNFLKITWTSAFRIWTAV